jgi:hypothetical protein
VVASELAGEWYRGYQRPGYGYAPSVRGQEKVHPDARSVYLKIGFHARRRSALLVQYLGYPRIDRARPLGRSRVVFLFPNFCFVPVFPLGDAKDSMTA